MVENRILRHWVSLKRRKYFITAFTLLGLAISWYSANYVVKPIYSAQTSVLINQSPRISSIQYDTILANEALVNTYTEIILSDRLAMMVRENLQLPLSAAELKTMIQVTNPGSSQIIDIKILAPSQVLAADIANEVAKDFQIQVSQLMNLKNVQIVDAAIINPHARPDKPNKKLDILAGTLGGFTLGALIALFLEGMDRRIKFIDEVEREFHLPLIGSMPDDSWLQKKSTQ